MKKNITKLMLENKVIILSLVFSIIVGILNPNFFTWDNFISTIVETNAFWGILAIGMTVVILTGGIDLSIGSMLALVGFGMLTFVKMGVAVPIGFIIALIFGAILGGIQGSLIGILKLPAFIITLVGMLVFRGVVRIWADGTPASVESDFLFKMATGDFLGIPYQVWILILVALGAWFMLKHTKLGRHIYATGSNAEAAQLAGVKTKKIIIFAYLFMGLMVGVSVWLFSSTLQSVHPSAAMGYELDAIAAVVLGGTALEGGKGGIGKTMVGWIVISILGNALVFIGLTSEWQTIFKGLVILVTIIFDQKDFLIKRKM